MDRESESPRSRGPMPHRQRPLKDQLHHLVDELVDRGVTLAQARQEFERQFIAASIRSSNGNLCRSARRLGVHRNTLRNKLTRLGIRVDEMERREAPLDGDPARPRTDR